MTERIQKIDSSTSGMFFLRNFTQKFMSYRKALSCFVDVRTIELFCGECANSVDFSGVNVEQVSRKQIKNDQFAIFVRRFWKFAPP